MESERCRLCGDSKPLNVNGVCKWTHGCEHRRAVKAAREDAVVKEAEQIVRSYGQRHW